MAHTMLQEFWRLVARQHGVIARWQLIELGFSREAIAHRIRCGRLHRLEWRGVYAVGRPEITPEGRWMAAILACGPRAVLSGRSAAALWRMGDLETGEIEVSVPNAVARRRGGIEVRRRLHLPPEDTTTHECIPVTSPTRTVIDLAPRLSRAQLERVINEACGLQILDVDRLRKALDDRAGQHGVRRVASVLDSRTFRLTRSELERRFLPIVEAAGLPVPETRRVVNGFETDFYWPELGLVVETDGLRYHRTPAQQARDRLRDQAHTAAGLTALRFTHQQVRYDRPHVTRTLRAVAFRLASGRSLERSWGS